MSYMVDVGTVEVQESILAGRVKFRVNASATRAPRVLTIPVYNKQIHGSYRANNDGLSWKSQSDCMSFLKIIHEARLVARSDGRCKLTRKLGVGSGDARDTTVVESNTRQPVHSK